MIGNLLRKIQFPKDASEEAQQAWFVWIAKAMVAGLLALVLGVGLAIAFNFSAYYTAKQENVRLIQAVEGMNERLALALLEREGQVAARRSMETFLLKNRAGEATKTAILTINSTVSEFVVEKAKDKRTHPVTETRDELCGRLEAKKLPCYH